MSLYGLDISYCQKGISWSEVKNKGVKFVLIRAGNDLHNRYDTQFDDHIKHALELNIPVGIYWYALARTPEQARQEALWCIEKISDYKSKLSLPVYYDVEEVDILNASNCSAIVDAFRSTMQSKGYRTGLYCSTGWIVKINQAVVNMHDSVWIAEWGDRCNYKGRYDIWQTGKTPRFGSVVADEDIMINDIIKRQSLDLSKNDIAEIKKELEQIKAQISLIGQSVQRIGGKFNDV